MRLVLLGTSQIDKKWTCETSYAFKNWYIDKILNDGRMYICKLKALYMYDVHHIYTWVLYPGINKT